MDEATNPIPSINPVVSVSENKIKKTFKLFRDSWRSFSKIQKFQLIAVFALVLALPTLLGGVYAVKLYRSGAATPPITPTPYPTSNPSSSPILNTSSLPQIYWNVPYTATVDAYDASSSGDTLNMTVSTLPSGLSLNNCKRYTSDKNHTAIISCTLSGIPATADLNWTDHGIFNTKVTVSNGSGSTTNELRIPFWTVSTASPTPPPNSTPTPPPSVDCYTCNQNNQCVFDAGCKMPGIKCSGTGVCPTVRPTPRPTITPTPPVKPTIFPTIKPTIMPKPTVRPIPIPTPIPQPICRFRIFGYCLIWYSR